MAMAKAMKLSQNPTVSAVTEKVARSALMSEDRAAGLDHDDRDSRDDQRERQRVESGKPCGRAPRPLTAPDADEQVHRHQQQSPERREQHEVRRAQHPVDSGLEQQDEDHVEADALVDLPRVEHRDAEDGRDDNEQWQA